MKIIDLLNKIANGEEPPNFEYYGGIYKYDKHTGNYWCNDMWFDFSSFKYLNDEIEIIEEKNKIPEKLKIEQDTPTSNYYIRNEYGTKCGLTKHSKIIADKLNEIIDYLKSKGE